MGDARESWYLAGGEHDDVVEIAQGRLVREVWWTRDGTEVATKKTSDETIVLTAQAHGAVRLKFALVGPARRVTLHGSETEAHTGLGGADFEPEPGSRAAERAEWIGRHPHLHTARQTAVAAAGVVVPIVAIWLLTLVPWPSVDVPDLGMPSIPWPDLPAVPWPDLPAVPWPDLDLPDLPAWVDTVRKLLIPILIAFFIARGEVRRRRKAEAAAAAGSKAESESESEQGPTRS